MSVIWDTFGLFEMLLDTFESAIRATGQNSSLDRLAMAIAAAKIGFQRFAPVEAWGESDDAYVADMIAGDLYDESVEIGYPDCPEADFLFACYGFGAMLGKRVVGEIGDPGHMLGITHLGAFRDTEFRRICDKYKAVLGILKNE